MQYASMLVGSFFNMADIGGITICHHMSVYAFNLNLYCVKHSILKFGKSFNCIFSAMSPSVVKMSVNCVTCCQDG